MVALLPFRPLDLAAHDGRARIVRRGGAMAIAWFDSVTWRLGHTDWTSAPPLDFQPLSYLPGPDEHETPDPEQDPDVNDLQQEGLSQ